MFLLGCNRVTLGKLGGPVFRHELLSGVGTHLSGVNMFGVCTTRSAVCIRPGNSVSARRALSILGEIFNITGVYPTSGYRGDLSTVRGATITLLSRRRATNGGFGIRTGERSGDFPLGSPRLSTRVNNEVLSDVPRLGISIRGPSVLIRVRVEGSTCICAHGVGKTKNVPIKAGNGTAVLLSKKVSDPITNCVVTGHKIQLRTIRFRDRPCADSETGRGIVSLTRVVSGCYNGVGIRIVPFASVRLRVVSGYPGILLAIVVHQVVVHVTRVITREANKRTLIAKRDVNRITDRAVRDLVTASDIMGHPMFEPLVNVSGRRVMEVSGRVRACRASVLPFRSYYAVFIPGRPGAGPTLRRLVRTRGLLRGCRRVLGATIRGRRIVGIGDCKGKGYWTSWQGKAWGGYNKGLREKTFYLWGRLNYEIIEIL